MAVVQIRGRGFLVLSSTILFDDFVQSAEKLPNPNSDLRTQLADPTRWMDGVCPCGSLSIQMSPRYLFNKTLSAFPRSIHN